MILPKLLQTSARLLVIGLFFCAMGAPQVLLAEETSCACFCGDRENGAEELWTLGSTNECAQQCADWDTSPQKVYVGCFTDESQYPKNSNLCWTAEECQNYEIKGEKGTTTWGEQSEMCSKQEVTGAEMGYCYGPLISTVLNVPILGETEVQGLGEYINLIYKFSIPLVAIIAIFFFVIAGLQYMTAGGSKKAVTAAKDRMQNAVIGIILLMAIYAIAYLIDPRLTRFQELRPPLVKKAVIIDGATTCEALYSYGFCIDGKCPNSGGQQSMTNGDPCGNKGIITGDDNLNLNIVNAPEVGDTCLYSWCEEKGAVCIAKGDGSNATCATCDDISEANDTLGIEPSGSVCAQIASTADAQDTNENHEYRCYYDDDFSSVIEGADAIGYDECVLFYTESDYINCTELQSEARSVEDGCDVYEKVNANSYGISNNYAAFVAEFFGQGSADQVEDFKNNFGAMCEQDICGVANLGEVKQNSCSFVDTGILADMLDNFVPNAPGIFNVFDDYGCAGYATLHPPETQDVYEDASY